MGAVSRAAERNALFMDGHVDTLRGFENAPDGCELDRLLHYEVRGAFPE
jgi:prepilin-type processing-associated H-X9-DG protein